jgi:hypothetical protein
MIGLAAALLVPLLLAATAVPLVAGWDVYRAFELMLGSNLALSNAIGRYVIVLGTMLAIIGLKLAAPALILNTWPRQRVAAIVFALTWVGALAACAMTVVLAVRAMLPSKDSSQAYLVAVAATWLSFDAIVSLLPAALAQAWGSATPNVAATGQETVATGTPSIHVRSPEERSVPRRLGKDYVLAALLASVDADAPDAAGRTIVMTQGGMAKQLGMPKGTINRHLRQLQKEGRIELVASPTKTRITVVRQVATAGTAVTRGSS